MGTKPGIRPLLGLIQSFFELLRREHLDDSSPLSLPGTTSEASKGAPDRHINGLAKGFRPCAKVRLRIVLGHLDANPVGRSFDSWAAGIKTKDDAAPVRQVGLVDCQDKAHANCIVH